MLKKGLPTALVAACLLMPHAPARAEWKPTEKIVTYPVSGRTGIDLYRSIGENGPKVGIGRVIAYTDFDLKWSRDYQKRNGGCVLASAKPFLTITYRLPKVSGDLPPETRRLWETFVTGVEKHERVHGEIILDMVKKIEAFSVGLTVQDDPNCKKIREVLTKKLGELSQEQRQKSRAFDRVEMSDGGNVHQLVLALVNGE